jgi:hypothetical protein
LEGRHRRETERGQKKPKKLVKLGEKLGKQQQNTKTEQTKGGD